MSRTWRCLVSCLLFAVTVLAPACIAPAHAGSHPVAYLTWYGQSCFMLESASGTRILMDPIPTNIGYQPPADLHVNAVTISHEHSDHNNVALVQGKPRILRGLTADKKGWMKIDEKIKDISVRSVGVYHDTKRGAENGLDTVFIFETGGVRIAHLGDLGHPLTDQQISDIGSVDVVLVPVGGGTTIDAQEATHVVDQIPAAPERGPHALQDRCRDHEGPGARGCLSGRTHQRPARAGQPHRHHGAALQARGRCRGDELQVAVAGPVAMP